MRVELLVVLEFRLEVLRDVRRNDGGEFGGVVVTTEDGCEDGLERVGFAEEVCNE
jgi:hypothetical protein